MYDRDRIDAAAEAEGVAIDWLNEHVEPQPPTRLETLREYARCAAERGLPDPPPTPRYARGKAVRAWCDLLAEFAAGRCPVDGPRTCLDTRADRERQRLRREARARLVKDLARRRGEFALREAASVAGIGLRTLERARAERRLLCVKRAGRVVVPVPALRAYLARKVAVAS